MIDFELSCVCWYWFDEQLVVVMQMICLLFQLFMCEYCVLMGGLQFGFLLLKDVFVVVWYIMLWYVIDCNQVCVGEIYMVLVWMQFDMVLMLKLFQVDVVNNCDWMFGLDWKCFNFMVIECVK